MNNLPPVASHSPSTAKLSNSSVRAASPIQARSAGGSHFENFRGPSVFQQATPPAPAPPPGDANAAALAGIDPSQATPEQIRHLQDDLIALGYLPEQYRQPVRNQQTGAEDTLDPDYGEAFDTATQQALERFQLDHGITDVAPGQHQLSPQTVAALTAPTYGGPFQPQYQQSPRLPATAYQPYAGAWPPNPAVSQVLPMNPDLATLMTTGPALDRTSTDTVRIGLAQARLLELGYLDPAAMSSPGYLSAYGDLTSAAVYSFQQAEGLPPTGVADAITLQHLANPEQAGFGPHYGELIGQYPAAGPTPASQLLGGALDTSGQQLYPTNPQGTFVPNSNNGNLTVAQSVDAWNGWCLAFVSRSFGSTSLTTRSPISRRPLVTVSRPATMRSTVLLPQPEGPTKTMNSPSRTSRQRSRMTATSGV